VSAAVVEGMCHREQQAFQQREHGQMQP